MLPKITAFSARYFIDDVLRRLHNPRTPMGRSETAKRQALPSRAHPQRPREAVLSSLTRAHERPIGPGPQRVLGWRYLPCRLRCLVTAWSGDRYCHSPLATWSESPLSRKSCTVRRTVAFQVGQVASRPWALRCTAWYSAGRSIVSPLASASRRMPSTRSAHVAGRRLGVRVDIGFES